MTVEVEPKECVILYFPGYDSHRRKVYPANYRLEPEFFGWEEPRMIFISEGIADQFRDAVSHYLLAEKRLHKVGLSKRPHVSALAISLLRTSPQKRGSHLAFWTSHFQKVGEYWADVREKGDENIEEIDERIRHILECKEFLKSQRA